MLNFWMWLYDNLNVLVYDAYVLKMDEDQWRYDFAMSQEVHMDYDYDNQEECGVNEPHVDCSNAFNTSQVFATRDDVLQWARTVAHENGFVAVIMRSDTETGSRGRNSFVLIGCERSGTYKCRNKEFVRKDTGSRKCGCLFRLRGKPVRGGEGWMVKLICGIHNHELAKSLVGHPYAGRLTKEEKKIIADMTKSMVKPKNILLTLKEHNADSCTTIKQIYNARSAYRSSIRGVDTEMQHLMKLLERDQYIHWHRLKDEVVVRDLFWCHPDAVKLCNACHLVYRLPLLDFVGVTPTAMHSLLGLHIWRLSVHDRLPLVIVTDRDLALMNAVKTVFPESTNLLCRFHIDKNVKAKCKSLIGKKMCGTM
ncbi:PKS-NRPS hybrid synthetase [Glycine max]|nr:PKS-NRPS hybrid synthetase [Glycine max]